MSDNENERADALLTGLVERYSPSTHERSAAAFLVQQMAALGFQAEVDDAGNAVGSLGDGPTTILLLGHIDTVRGYINVRREGSLLHGRGTVDAKGPLATFVAATAAAGPLPGKRVVVAGAVEEESATSKGARYLLDRLTPDAVVIGEPSGWDRVTVGYKGRLLVDYTLRREIGHTAGPNGSVSEEAFGFWAGVQAYVSAYNEGQQRMFSRLSPSLRTMNSVSDGLTETATLTIGFRLPPGLDAGALQTRITELAGDGRLRFRGLESAYHASKSTRLARAFVKAIDAEGGRVQFKVKSGTSDMNVVGHTPREHIDLDEYHCAIAVLRRVLVEL